MLKEEEIIELLTKENLSESDRERILDELRSNPGLRDIKRILSAIADLSKGGHIEPEVLSEYVLYVNGDNTNESNLTLLTPRIEKHLQSCSKCMEEFEYLSSELNETDDFLSEQIKPAEKAHEERPVSKNLFGLINNSQIKYSFAAAASIFVAFLSLFVVSEISTPDYIKVSSQFNNEDFSTTRGRSSSYFLNAVSALENENYDFAINQLQEDIEENKDDLTIFYSHYVLGITHLTKAHSDFIGLFDSYDKVDLPDAISNFNKVLELNNSGLFPNVNFNTYFFLGKSYLLSEDFDNAKKYFIKAVDNRAEYAEKAEKLLDTLE